MTSTKHIHTSEAFISCSLSFLLRRRRWRNRACCSRLSCRITAFACLTFSFSACSATASEALFIWILFRMVWEVLATAQNACNGWHNHITYQQQQVLPRRYPRHSWFHLWQTDTCILTIAFVYHSGPSPAGSRCAGQPFGSPFLHLLLDVLQTLLVGLLLDAFFHHSSGLLNILMISNLALKL